MAAPKTVKTYDLNGTLKDFPITFEYLARKFITVTLIGTDRRELILNTDYRFSTPTQITTLRSAAWGSADNYELIEIRRLTSATDRLVDFADGSILRAFDLNTSQIQSLHIAEEARDLTADTIGVNDEGNLDARAKRIVNVADPVDPGDVVTLRYEQDWAASTLSNKIASETARTGSEAARDLANTYKSNALASANASEESNLEAKDWASKAEDSVVSGGLYSSYHYSRKAAAQVPLAAAQADIATTQAGLATTNGAAQVALATTQAGIATTQAGLATTNGAAQVALATTQKDLATTQAGIATTKASEAAASAAVVAGVIAVNRSFRNLLINGDFPIWQRRTSWTISGSGAVFCADRWLSAGSSGTCAVSLQSFTIGQSDVPDNPAYYCRHAFSGLGSASGDNMYLTQRIENVRTASAQTVTLTFWAKSAVNGQKMVTEMLQGFGSGGSAEVQFSPSVLSLTTSWTKYTRTISVPSVSGKTAPGIDNYLAVVFWFGAGSSFNTRLGTTAWNTAGTIDISHVQIEIGIETPFERRPPSVEIDLCQRYMEVVGGTVSPSHGPYAWKYFKVTKFKAPTCTVVAGTTPGTSVDLSETDGFRFGNQATANADWRVYAESEL